MNRMNAVLNGREVEAYFLIDTPPLFQYASNKRQISLVDMDLLNVHFAEDSPLAGASLNNTPAIIVLKNYLLTRIEGHEEPKQPSAKPKDPVHIHLRGARRAVAHQAAPPAPAQLHRDLSQYLTQQNYISGYSFTRTGRVVDGVEIVLDRTTRRPAPTPS